MKKYPVLLFIALLLIFKTANAQIALNLALNSRPQPWLADWANPVNGQMIITLTAGTIAPDPIVKLRTTLLNDAGTVIGISNPASASTYNLRLGVNQFSVAEALQLQNLSLAGNVKSLLLRGGRLSAGQYQLMVEVLNASGDIVRAKQTKPFFITAYNLPVLMQPANGGTLDAHIAQNVIIFRWTSITPVTTEIPIYRVQVFEILPGQTPMQAFRGNRPLLDEPALKGMTQFVWRPQLPMFDSTANRRFIWTVQTLDRDGLPLPANDNTVQGRSEPAVFSIINQRGALPGRKEESTKN